MSEMLPHCVAMWSYVARVFTGAAWSNESTKNGKFNAAKSWCNYQLTFMSDKLV